MAYKDLLDRIITESGLNLREISRRCRNKGVSLAPSYLSKLRSGKQAPPSEEVSRAIADVCGASAERLVWEGYLEKAPEVVREFVQLTYNALADMLRKMAEYQYPDLAEQIMKQMESLSPVEVIRMSLESALQLSEKIFVDANESFQDESGTINFNLLEGMGVLIEDDSMEPLIPRGSRVAYNPKEPVTNGKLALLEYERRILVRKVYEFGDQLLLVSINPKSESLRVSKEQVRQFGAVVAYSKEL